MNVPAPGLRNQNGQTVVRLFSPEKRFNLPTYAMQCDHCGTEYGAVGDPEFCHCAACQSGTASANDDEKDYLALLVKDAEDTVNFLSNPHRCERERSVCAAFLRCVGQPFLADEITAGTEEPVDVSYVNARFQIRDVDDENRRRHLDWKKELERRKKARSVAELMTEYHPPREVHYSELIPRLVSALARKALRYGDLCATTDALVYVNLSDSVLDIGSEMPPPDDLKTHGWRSVSFVIPPYGQVLLADRQAPQFLQDLVGPALAKWDAPFLAGLFAL